MKALCGSLARVLCVVLVESLVWGSCAGVCGRIPLNTRGCKVLCAVLCRSYAMLSSCNSPDGPPENNPTAVNSFGSCAEALGPPRLWEKWVGLEPPRLSPRLLCESSLVRLLCAWWISWEKSCAALVAEFVRNKMQQAPNIDTSTRH